MSHSSCPSVAYIAYIRYLIIKKNIFPLFAMIKVNEERIGLVILSVMVIVFTG